MCLSLKKTKNNGLLDSKKQKRGIFLCRQTDTKPQ
jgi:hypothetical protein